MFHKGQNEAIKYLDMHLVILSCYLSRNGTTSLFPDPFLTLSLSVPEEAPAGVITTVMNSTVRVKWNEAQNVRGLLLGYKVQYHFF